MRIVCNPEMTECAIPMCGEEGPLIPACENRHWLHARCMRAIAESCHPSPPLCPMCRSSSVDSAAKSATVPIECLFRTPYTILGATVAVVVGKSQHGINHFY